MLILALLGLAQSSAPDFNSAEFATKLATERKAEVPKESTVNVMTASLVIGASWTVCAWDDARRSAWVKKMSLTAAEELILLGSCFSYASGRDSAVEELKNGRDGH